MLYTYCGLDSEIGLDVPIIFKVARKIHTPDSLNNFQPCFFQISEAPKIADPIAMGGEIYVVCSTVYCESMIILSVLAILLVYP